MTFAKGLVTTGLAYIPGVGVLISGLVGIFWPDSNNPDQVWGEIRNQVEALVDQKIGQSDYNLALGVLNDYNGKVGKYLTAVKDYYTELETDPKASPSNVQQDWNNLNLDLGSTSPFQQTNYQTQLLPLYVQCVNMYLAVLRDGVIYGANWGIDVGAGS